ncbi:hypothetical protein Kpho01_64610 [Kitasatospora phosalacinea]|uniref:Uncharacterized protein n=1 Tax=Kitasatospora phosalacinea TaxID=2065 RepID=A0A9W6PNT2_9ACTN|nr:hypothetical protein Kpho01_64610 [Kitasatospora phosalacinea]
MTSAARPLRETGAPLHTVAARPGHASGFAFAAVFRAPAAGPRGRTAAPPPAFRPKGVDRPVGSATPRPRCATAPPRPRRPDRTNPPLRTRQDEFRPVGPDRPAGRSSMGAAVGSGDLGRAGRCSSS